MSGRLIHTFLNKMKCHLCVLEIPWTNFSYQIFYTDSFSAKNKGFFYHFHLYDIGNDFWG